MNIVCLGLNHRTAGVEVRERFAVPESELAVVGRKFTSIEGVSELVVLSTCNRVEFYAAGDGLASGYHALERFLSEHSGLATPELEVLYRYDFPHSAGHLFGVVCGIDSMVVGETEIHGQVKQAYEEAVRHGLPSRVLNKLFQRAFRVAKQVRTRTSINRGSVSVASVAADLAERIFGSLRRCRALVLGTGETGEKTARSLRARGLEGLTVANRSPEKARALAEALGGRAVGFDRWIETLAEVDILVTSTAARCPVVTEADVATAMAHRADRPLFIIDIAVPRDVAPGVQHMENVFLYDIDSLEAIAAQSIELRRREITLCQEIIGEHVSDFARWLALPAGTRPPDSFKGRPGGEWEVSRP
jgi:glutamyl-tRNA reductase